jgi:branched-chain amino acid transport system substrate-binding protein
VNSKLSLSALLAVLLAGCSHGSGGTVTFGAAGPEHDPNGAANRKGIELALDEINSGANPRYHFAVQFEDDSANGARAARVAQHFVDSAKIVAVIGHVNSGAMMAAARVYDIGLPAIATSATSPALSGISKWAFRVIASDSLNGVRIADYMGKLGHKRAVVLYENNAYGRGLADSFRRGWKGEIVGMDPVSDRPGEDLEPFVSWIKQQGADMVLVAGTASSGLSFLKEARKQQLSVALAGGNGWATMIGDPLAEGAYFPTPFNPDDTRPEVRAFVASYQKKFNESPSAYAALAYDATKLLAAVVNKVGPNRVNIRDYLATMSEPYHGVTGAIAFAPNGDPKDKSMAMARIHDRRMQPEGGQ